MTEEQNKKELFLSSSRLFGGLPYEDIRRIASAARIINIRKKKSVYNEGEPADRFYLVVDGKIKIFKKGRGRKKQLLHFVLPGEFCAAAAMFCGGNYAASSMAAQDTELIYFHRNDFLAILRKNPELSMRMLGNISRLCRRFIGLVEDLTLRSVPGRVAAYILAKTPDESILPGQTIDLGISKGELASRLGIVNETLSRTLKRFKDEGLIKTQRREITILNPEKLHELVTSPDKWSI